MHLDRQLTYPCMPTALRAIAVQPQRTASDQGIRDAVRGSRAHAAYIPRRDSDHLIRRRDYAPPAQRSARLSG